MKKVKISNTVIESFRNDFKYQIQKFSEIQKLNFLDIKNDLFWCF